MLTKHDQFSDQLTGVFSQTMMEAIYSNQLYERAAAHLKRPVSESEKQFCEKAIQACESINSYMQTIVENVRQALQKKKIKSWTSKKENYQYLEELIRNANKIRGILE